MLEQLTPWIMLEEGTKIRMILSKKDENQYFFVDDKNSVHLKLTVKECGKVRAFFADAVVEQVKDGTGSIASLNAECAVGFDIGSVGDIKGYMADYLDVEWWCAPYTGIDLKKIPKDTQALLWEKRDGSFGYLLAVCDEKYKCTFNGSEDGLTVKVFTWYPGLTECKTLAFLLAEGENPFELSEKCAEFGLELLDTGYTTRKERRYPEIFEYLGWCSWDALQIRVNTGGLLEKCEEFKQKEIPVRWAIIDDMWAEVKGLNDVSIETPFLEMCEIMHRSRLYSFEADKARFPGGLKACIEKIKADYGLKVGIWHPTTGYWKGIDPDGPIAKEHRDLLVETENGDLVHSPELDKAFQFYNTFHSYLKKCGADFVKIDDQSFYRRFFKGMLPVGQAARNLHRALESSVGSNFDGRIINCAGMSVENMWNRPNTAIARCSNDFLPENREWFIKHILMCSCNSFVHGNFQWCDWDMWWSDDGQAVKNSVLRAVSGGPVYLSDKIGRSVKEVIMPLILSDGRILRCDQPAVPTRDCLIVDAETAEVPFKVWNRCKDSGIVAAFNLNKDNRAVAGSLSAHDVEGLEGQSFAVFEYFSRSVRVIGRQEKLEFALENQDDFKLFILVPIMDGFAPIGLINKYISPAAIANAASGHVELYEAGLFAFVSEKEVEAVSVNGKSHGFEKRDSLYIVDWVDEQKTKKIATVVVKRKGEIQNG